MLSYREAIDGQILEEGISEAGAIAIWAAADQRSRGFLLGATSGRTTLGGEGLQHQDGTSHLVASTIPNCMASDPAFAGEMAVPAVLRLCGGHGVRWRDKTGWPKRFSGWSRCGPTCAQLSGILFPLSATCCFLSHMLETRRILPRLDPWQRGFVAFFYLSPLLLMALRAALASPDKNPAAEPVALR